MSRFAFPLGLIGVSIISISSLVSAVDYPSTTPNGEIPGGTFNQYFSNFLGPAASCLPGQVVSGFSSSGILQCITSSGYWNSSNGGSSIYFPGTGNVGIGIVNPADKLHIQFNSPSAGIVMTNLANSVGSRGFRVSNDNNRFNIQKTYDDGTFQANLLNILTNGFVGIGTINPQRALDINSDSSWHSMRITRDFETHWTDFIQRPSSYGAPNVFSIYNYNRGNYYHGLSISQDGNVGIGTETPSHKLEVNGSDGVAYFASNGGNAYIRLGIYNDINRRIELANRDGRTALWNPQTGDAFNIYNNGNVTIGTLNQDQKLNVAGAIVADDIYLRNHGRWASQSAYNILVTVNDVNNGGGAPCNNNYNTPSWALSCASRACRQRGYVTGYAIEWDLSSLNGGVWLTCMK